MAFPLGFHIILASVGVAFPAIMLIANHRGLRKRDEDALELARRWSKVVPSIGLLFSLAQRDIVQESERPQRTAG